MNEKQEHLVEVIKLPHSTGECDIGPEIRMVPGEILVRYDIEGERSPVWTTIRFTGAVALKVIPETGITELHTPAYSRVCRVENSIWREFLLRPQTGESLSLPVDRHHFVIFFDHYGAVEVLAQRCEVLG